MTNPPLAETDKKSGARLYKNPITGKRVPSVTTILGVKNKPALMWWAAGMAARRSMEEYRELFPRPGETWESPDYVARALRYIDPKPVKNKETGEVEPFDVEDEVWKYIRKAHSVYRDKKADMGDQVHKLVEAVALGEALPAFDDDARAYVGPVLAWLEEHKPRFLGAEVTVWSEEDEYAGTLDSLWAFGASDEVWLLDTKTGNDVWPETCLQLAALGHAPEKLHPDGTTEPMPEIAHYGILHIIPDVFADDGTVLESGWATLHQVDEFIPAARDAFLGLRQAQRWNAVEGAVLKALQGRE